MKPLKKSKLIFVKNEKEKKNTILGQIIILKKENLIEKCQQLPNHPSLSLLSLAAWLALLSTFPFFLWTRSKYDSCVVLLPFSFCLAAIHFLKFTTNNLQQKQQQQQQQQQQNLTISLFSHSLLLLSTTTNHTRLVSRHRKVS